ncbi:MAG TPA: hypothetical protein VGD58_04600 [Herpetosiphonaceae bacterium]
MAMQKQTTERRQRIALWWRWTLATAAGELVGFAVPALIGVLAAMFSLSDRVRLVPLVLAGMGEGAILGLAQWLALRSILPKVAGRSWVGVTTLAAGLAWTIGLVPSTFADLQALSVPLRVTTFAMLGVVFLLSIGGAQWLILRRLIPRAGWWIPANAIAWPLGVAVPVLGLSLLPDTASVGTMLGIGIGCGMLMGLVVGAITGVVLLALLHDRPGTEPHTHTGPLPIGMQ